MSVFKIGDTIMLETENAFQVMEVVEYEGDSYLYAIEVPENPGHMADPKLLSYAFLKESVDEETDEAFVEQVKDVELIKTLTQEVLDELG